MNRLKSFDLISDIHLDMHIFAHLRKSKNSSYELAQLSEKQYIEAFTKSLIPSIPSKVLVIAGDLGHDNLQNQQMLEVLSDCYEYVLFTFGNHDLYLIPKYSKQYSSIERWNEMKRFVSHLSNVYVLEGSIVEIGGVTFGGTGMWYDFSYGMKKGLTWMECYRHWTSTFNDFNFIKGLPQFEEELEKLKHIITNGNVVVTHVAPDLSQQQETESFRRTTMFYYFDPSSIIQYIKGKVWCHGHIHRRRDQMIQDCRIISHPLGYPDELLPTSARTILL